jgi:hypothetical protein
MMSTTAETIKDLELQLLQREVRASPARLSELLGPGFIEIGSSGRRYTREEVLEQLPHAEPLQYRIEDFQALELSPGVVLAVYRLFAPSPSGGLMSSHRSSLWKVRDAHWQIIFHQGTTAEP